METSSLKGTRAAKAYAGAGSVAFETLSALRTILSLNAVTKSIESFAEKTRAAFEKTKGLLVREGLANGSVTAAFIVRMSHFDNGFTFAYLKPNIVF